MKILARRPRLALPIRVALGAAFAILFGAPGCSHGSLVGSCLGLDEFTNCKGGPVDDSVPCGGGGSVSCESEADCPASKSPCGRGVCDKGVCSIEPAEPKGTSCDDHGGKTCDGDGSCVECLASTDCRNETACVKSTCSAEHACETTNEKQGEACSDHDGTVCDGVGTCVACNAKEDCAEPSTKCLELSGCTDHQCISAPQSEGSACADHGGNVCDVAGHCFGARLASVGDGVSCAVTTRGGVKCWGANGAGQVGDGTMADRPTPVTPKGLEAGIAKVATARSHTCAVTTAGSVECWGLSQLLGIGSGQALPGPNEVPGLTGAVALGAAGALGFPAIGDTCVVLESGSVSCWGSNDGSWLGPTTSHPQSVPATIPGFVTVASISVGNGFACAITKSGAIQCIGENGAGQLGNGTTDPSPTPVGVPDFTAGATKIATGAGHACAIVQSNVWCWGDNSHGQLGLGTTGDYSPTPGQVSGVAGIDVSVGEFHSCAVNAAGAAFCWGDNQLGQLGDGTTTDSNVPVAVMGASSGVLSVAAGHYASCAVSDDGHMSCWGSGALGDGTGMDMASPVSVHGL